MQAIGFNFSKINVEKKKDIKEKIEIKSNIDINNIKKEAIDVVKDKNTVKIDFTFTINYTPEIAELSFSGTIVLILDDKDYKQVLKEWKKKKLPDNIRTPLFNLIMTRSSLRALQLEEEINLPPHFPFPRLMEKDKKQSTSYTG